LRQRSPFRRRAESSADVNALKCVLSAMRVSRQKVRTVTSLVMRTIQSTCAFVCR
jgi:hypothetical protein